MAKKLLILGILLSFQTIYSQDTIVYFSDALRMNIKEYIKASDEAYENNDIQEGKRLFDSLIQHNLIGTQFDDFTVKRLSSKKVRLNSINKPLLIITYASWCVINKGDAPALNQLAKEHHGNMDIMVLFWDTKSNIKKIARQFSNDIMVCYANEKYRNDFGIIARLKHTLGFPTTYFIDANKKVVTIKRVEDSTAPKTSFTLALNNSYQNFNSIINESLVKDSTPTSGVAKN